MNKQAIPETVPDYDRTRIIERPDGFYWRPRGANREYGPFDTLVAAVQDMQIADEATPEPGETLEQAEAEIGISEWIDPDTGTPAEEGRPRLEEH
jgi:hypothetical protein